MNNMSRLFLIILSIFSFNSCISISENDVKKLIISPDEKFVAVSFIRSSGATTSYSPQVSILPKNKKMPNKPGNVFIGDNSKYIDIYWKDDNTLLIYHNCKENNIFKRLNVFKKIKIEYIKISNEITEG
jgi:hypothetical protein